MNEQQERSGDWLGKTSTIAQYARMSPDEFVEDTRQKWSVAQQLRDVVVAGVQAESITPIDGARILSCATAGLFGYDAFHNQESGSPELVAALSGQIGSQHRDRELAGV